ncbi:hypothetical protein ACFSL4_05960 [Streptomyces caeni]|uniref:Amino acid permease/ SLC12A domain-containing protein n=1 Tax=Streptomyces caeni TaxID=2307231 RepID=A0ABW4IMP3_9ACTN
MAPAAAAAASIPSGAAFAGGSLPLSVLIALVACLFTAPCVAELARQLPAAGSVAAYAAQGLHPAVGFLVGWGIVVNLACAGYFLRRRRELFKPVRHLLFPLLWIAAFVPALPTAAGLPVFDFVTAPTAPVSYTGPVVGVWMAAGVTVLLVLVRRRPGRIAETARVHLDKSPTSDLRPNGAVQP